MTPFEFILFYLVSVFIGFMMGLDISRQAKDAGFQYETNWQLIKWTFNPNKRRIKK